MRKILTGSLYVAAMFLMLCVSALDSDNALLPIFGMLLCLAYIVIVGLVNEREEIREYEESDVEEAGNF